MTSLTHNHGPIPMRNAPYYPGCPACQARRFDLVTRVCASMYEKRTIATSDTSVQASDDICPDSYRRLLTCTVADKRTGHYETRNLNVERCPDRKWHVEVSRLNGGSVAAFGSTSHTACTLAFRGCGDSADDAKLLVSQIGHLLPENPDPAKPFPWFLLCVYAPLLAVAVVAGVWLILKSL